MLTGRTNLADATLANLQCGIGVDHARRDIDDVHVADLQLRPNGTAGEGHAVVARTAENESESENVQGNFPRSDHDHPPILPKAPAAARRTCTSRSDSSIRTS